MMASETPREVSWDNHVRMADMNAPSEVQILIDKTYPTWRLWVNVDGQCRLRIYGINPDTFTLNIHEADNG